MNTVKANNHTAAAREVAAQDKELGAKVPDTVLEKDAHLYHVLLIQKIHIEAEQRYETRVSTQKLNQRAFEKATKGLKQAGFDKMIVLHTPDKKVKGANPEDAQKATESTLNVVKEDKNLFAHIQEVQERLEKEYAAKWPDEPKPALVIAPNRVSVIGEGKKEIAQIVDTPELEYNDPSSVDLEALKSDDLNAFVKKYDINVEGKTTMKDILPVAKEWQSSLAKK